ncbi:MAG TPA: hydroxysqualene dehydroxylase HpnE [Xanthobacteraceae bacterium]|nr:hydroxysqualene dehydroxylase HpnE [Xanthobacteraceae bacterium]
MPLSDRDTVHIIGAGLAGLAAAVRLADGERKIIIHEATEYAGGRCRSYFDEATGMLIDNGTHLVLSGNHAARAFVRTIGAEAGLQGPEAADFPFLDLATDKRWTLRFGSGLFPWWIFDKDRRVPETSAIDYLPLARLMWPAADRPLGEVVASAGPLYERLLTPFFLAALNIEPREASTKLAAALIRETGALGGKACRPLMAPDGIGNVFIEPALDYLQRRGVSVSFKHELHGLGFDGGRVTALDFGGEAVALSESDAVILAVPAYTASRLLPDLQTPSAFRGIVNAHFRADPPEAFPPMLGIINGTCDWIFSTPGRVSVTISDADRFMPLPREALAEKIWQEVAAVMKLPRELPPWQLVRERRATFAATPEENARRPRAETAWRNFFLAGDWTATGLPATLEGAIRSGNRAAELVNGAGQRRIAA